MQTLDYLKQDEEQRKKTVQGKVERAEAHALLQRLVQPRQYVGDVYSLGYESASVQIHDFHRRKVGGIPSLCFLVASREETLPEDFDYQREDSSVILLRVMDATPLPGHAEAERVRVELAQKVSGEPVNWDNSQAMDPTTNHVLSFAGIECRVIGTFFVDRSARRDKLALRFGSDISNYYPNQGLKVYKPNLEALQEIVNYADVDRIDDALSNLRVEIGEVRYASTNRSFQGVSSVKVYISPADLLGQKSALFGMTRTGKSNTTKIILQSVFKLRFAGADARRIGQIVFDPNGEYANENAQDAGGNKVPTAIKNVWRANQLGQQADVVTYGVRKHPNDPDRKLMLLNFYEDVNLQTGKEIIDNALVGDNVKYISNFRQVTFEPPEATDRSATTRYARRVLVYRALLARAGFEPPANLVPVMRGLFNQELLDAMRNSADANFQSAARIISSASLTWKHLGLAFEYLAGFIGTPAYQTFEQNYIRTSSSGEPWADEDLKKLLTMFEYPNGPRLIGRVVEQHAASTTADYADAIYADLCNGRLVIVDQSSGDPLLNQSSSERIMWRIFKGQQELFRNGTTSIPDILVYVEEAHNLLPTGSDLDLQNVWVRTAKEGAKYHIGLVYATQEVSSIQRNILKNTANWFIGHLNNTDETKELCKYYDFADFEPSIRRAQDRGFLRVKTLSNLFVVPVQVKKFEV